MRTEFSTDEANVGEERLITAILDSINFTYEFCDDDEGLTVEAAL